MVKEKAAVVVPYYHEKLTETEAISFRNCLDTFKGKYPIVLVIPERMKKSPYLPLDVLYEPVPDGWLQSIDSYNQMMLSEAFYIRFIKYEYILIFQLDAFAISDSLQSFCDYGYDYIGAPWLKGMRYLRSSERGVWFVGNGGFSLRRVEAFMTILRRLSTESVNRHEDIFWASCDSADFHVAPMDIALKFSFEQDVRQCYEQNNNELPFGCHAWEKYDFDFWRPVFEGRGYFLTDELPGGIDCEESFLRWDYHYLDAEPEIVEQCLDNLLGRKKCRIYVWGTGKIGEECCWLLKRIKGQKTGYVGCDSKKQGDALWGGQGETDEVLVPKQEDIRILITDRERREDILSCLQNKGYGYKREVFFYDDLIEMIRRFRF
ncbi:MAG: hypothetical protein HFI38_12410 [Lachnospiraceae bacterium]|jgi:hypothetical protein|nr:hypothetical protein [Lachnospiraceae bacterium]